MANGKSGKWNYNGEFEIAGLDPDGVAGSSEIIAFNIGINKKVCAHRNSTRNIKGIPRLRSDQSALYAKRMIDDGVKDYFLSMEKQPELDHPALSGKLSGCFQSNNEKNYVIFTTVLNR